VRSRHNPSSRTSRHAEPPDILRPRRPPPRARPCVTMANVHEVLAAIQETDNALESPASAGLCSCPARYIACAVDAGAREHARARRPLRRDAPPRGRMRRPPASCRVAVETTWPWCTAKIGVRTRGLVERTASRVASTLVAIDRLPHARGTPRKLGAAQPRLDASARKLRESRVSIRGDSRMFGPNVRGGRDGPPAAWLSGKRPGSESG
jgi:hypothetical protein